MGGRINVTFAELLQSAVIHGASDILIIAGLPTSLKIGGKITRICSDRLTSAEAENMVRDSYATAGRSIEKLEKHGDDDFSFSVAGLSRFRVNAFRQRGSLATVIRVVGFDMPDSRKLGIPESVLSLCEQTKGLILVTGPAGSGKSTTLACMVDRINATRGGHIITIEDPIEYLHKHKNGVVTQRELTADTETYHSALRAAMRQAPDVILVGEMRDHETIGAAMTAAETGHLVISTLHTLGAAKTIDRIVDAFPPTQQQQIRVQLAAVLQGVVSQQLVECKPEAPASGVAPAFEIMRCNSAVRTMIRESKLHQLDGVIQTSQREGMVSMEASLEQLVEQGVVAPEAAIRASFSPERLAKRLGYAETK